MSSQGNESATGRAAVQAIAHFAAEEFERIAALSQGLLELMQQPRFYRSPALGAAQLSVIRELAEAASVSVDQLASSAGVHRAPDPRIALMEAAAKRDLDS